MNTKNTQPPLTYKGYTGSIDVSLEDSCMFGKILFINDMITYEGNTVDEIKTSFEEAVDRYLEYCEETGKPANKPYSGSFNIRIGQELHREAAQVAYHQGVKLNAFVAKSIKAGIEQSGTVKVEHTHHHSITMIDNQIPTAVVTDTDQPLAWGVMNAVATN